MPLWYTLSCSKNSAGNALEMANLFYESNLFSAIDIDFLVNFKLGTSARFISRNQATFAQSVKVNGSTLNLRLADNGNVSIFTLNGARVRAMDLGKGHHVLNLNYLPRGMYVIKVNSGAWKQSVRMIVK